MAVVNKNNIIDVVGADGAHYVKIYDMNENVIWEAGGGSDWQLDESSYIIGEDGKYYQKLIDWNKAVYNNPVPDLNNEWVEDTVTPEEERVSNYTYFMSEKPSVIGIGNFRQFKVQWKGLTSITFKVRLFSSWSSFNYVVVNGLDKPAFTSTPTYSTSGLQFVARGDNFNGEFTVECDEGEHHLWFCHTVPDSLGGYGNNPASVAIRNDLVFHPDGSIKKGSELRYEYIPSGEYINTHDDWYAEKIYKYYYTPDNLTEIPTSNYILGEEVKEILITRDYLRFDAVENDVHIGFSNLSLVNNLRYSRGDETKWQTFPTNGVDIQQGNSIYLKADGMSTSITNRTFITSAPVECHGNTMSLLGSDFEALDYVPDSAFRALFKNSKITTCPNLPAKTISSYGYSFLFDSCVNITEPPVVFNGEVFGIYACNYTFRGCNNLTKSPILKIKSDSIGAFSFIFQNCSKLNKITFSNKAYFNFSKTWWVDNVAPTGVIVLPDSVTSYSVDVSNVPVGWVAITKDLKVPLYFTPYYKYMHLDFNDLSLIDNLRYSRDLETWENFPIEGVDIHEEEKVYLRANGLSTDAVNRTFQTSEICSAGGNCNSLLDEDFIYVTELTPNCFRGLFKGIGALLHCPEFPAIKMATNSYYSLFEGCQSLNYPPKLPATSLAQDCYNRLFMGCISLKEAPALPATTLAVGCYNRLFMGCTKITSAPVLPAKNMQTSAYAHMFRDCTRLVNAPMLDEVESLASNCFEYMFAGCSSLVDAPDIPNDVSIVSKCFSHMFDGCSSLVNAPELTSTELKSNCYEYMFNNCTSLIVSPKIKATKIADVNCMQYMFNGCSQLNKVECDLRYISGAEITNKIATNWLDGVAEVGTFVKNPDWNTLSSRGSNTIPSSWDIVDKTLTPITRDYLRFDATNGNLHIGFYNLAVIKNLKYSFDYEEEWKNANESGVDVPNGGHVWFKANGNNNTQSAYFKFTTNQICECHGNCNSLLGEDFENIDTVAANGFSHLFEGTKIKTSPTFPANTIGNRCLWRTFYNCSELITAPELMAENLADYCYWDCFLGCSKLINVQETLPAKTIYRDSYTSMYGNCRSLTRVPDIEAETFGSQSLHQYAAGTNITETPNMTNKLGNNTLFWAFYNCKNLTKAVITAEDMNDSLTWAFEGCSKLNKVYCYIKSNNGTLLTGNYSLGERWLNGVASTGIFYKNPELPEPEVRGMHTIPAGWEIRDWTTYPEIPDDLIDEGDADGGDADGGDYDGSDDVQL